MNTDALESFAAGRKPKQKVEWRRPTLDDFQVGYSREVCAVDPSLNGFAAVLLSAVNVRDQVDIMVLAAKRFTTATTAAGGYEESLCKTMELCGLFGEWIVDVARGHSLKDIEFVHEGPPIGGGKFIRPESSLLGGAAMRFALLMLGMSPHRMIQPQSHKLFICGDRKATKKDHHAALKVLATDLGISGMEHITNEDQRDALSVGLLHLTRPQEKR